MKKPNQDDEPFFITEEIAAEMIAGGYELGSDAQWNENSR